MGWWWWAGIRFDRKALLSEGVCKGLALHGGWWGGARGLETGCVEGDLWVRGVGIVVLGCGWWRMIVLMVRFGVNI